MRQAVATKNAIAIYESLADDYYIRRDFGGTFDPGAPPSENFSWAYQFDNARLGREYQNLGWRRFESVLSGPLFERKNDGQLCTPHGALDTKPFPSEQLCFNLGKDGKWVIAGHINGGD